MSSGDIEDVEPNELNVPWRDTGPRRTNQRHLHEFNTCLHSFHVRLSTFLVCFYSASVMHQIFSAFILLSSASAMILLCFYYASIKLQLCCSSVFLMFLFCFHYALVLLLLCFLFCYPASLMLLFATGLPLLGFTSVSFHIII